MDLLHKRYASPFSLLDKLIENKQFNEYVPFLLNKEAKDRDEQLLWEYYLHKVFNKSFNEFRKETFAQSEGESKKNDATDEAKRNEIIEKSNAILNGFVPTKQKGGYK